MAKPEPKGKVEERMSKFMRNAIIIGSIAGVLLFIGIIAAAVIISNRSKTTAILVPHYS